MTFIIKVITVVEFMSAWFLDSELSTCCIRGGKEQRELKFSQLKKGSKIVHSIEKNVM